MSLIPWLNTIKHINYYRDYSIGSYFRDTLIPGAYGIFSENDDVQTYEQSEFEGILEINVNSKCLN